METEQTQEQGISRKLRNIVWIVVLGALTPMLDSTIINVALPTLGHAMHVSVATSQWTVTGYLLAMAIAMPASGWLTGRLGAKKMWIIALPLFLIGSMLSGIAWNMNSLIVFRVLQGLAAGLITPLTTTLILGYGRGKKLGQLMAIATLPIVVVPVFGPVIGGLIIGGLDWRWIFYVNVPICAVALFLAARYLPKTEPAQEKARFDIIGFALIAPALALLLYGLSQATGSSGFGIPSVYVSLIIGVVLATIFAIYALNKKRGKPLINLNPLRARAYSASLIILFFSGLSIYGAMVLISLFYQDDLGKTALMTGLLLAPQGIGSLLPRIFTGKLTDRIGPRPVILVGLLVTVLGTIAFTQANYATAGWLLAISLFIRGIGLTPVNIAVMTGAFQGVPKEDVPDASSTIRIVQQVGGAFGTAVLVVILSQALLHYTVLTPADHSQAFNITFWWSIGFTALAFIPALLLPKMVKQAS